MKPKALREDNTRNINHKSIKYADVSQAHLLGSPSSAPIVRRLNTRTAIQPAEVTKKTRREKPQPCRVLYAQWLSICNEVVCYPHKCSPSRCKESGGKKIILLGPEIERQY